MAKVFILLPVHNRKVITRCFIECLKSQTFSDFHLVLIDDGSTDGTAEMVLENIPDSTVLRGKGNWWWAGSLQQGLNWLKKNEIEKDALILFINDDVLFLPDYLAQSVGVMTDKFGVFMLSKYRMPLTGEIRESGVEADLMKLTFKEASAPEKINCLSTRGLIVHWSDVRKNGDFHQKLLPHYLSDYEYTIRAFQSGFKCETSSALLIEQNEETTGYHLINEKCFGKFLKKYFSIKSAGNPVYLSTFVLFRVKPIYVIQNLTRIWFRALKTILKSFVLSMKSCTHL